MIKMRLMLVDDEDRLLQTTRKLPAKHGYDAITAAGGADCLQKIEQELVTMCVTLRATEPCPRQQHYP
jgi:DNA-binding response OmpR family regulator